MRVVLPLLVLLLTIPSSAQSLGETSFPNSGAEAAQPAFLRGLLQLHSFEYQEAMEAFQEAQRLDPDFAMAYWGEALTHNHPIWMEQDREAARAVLERLGATADERLARAGTERERDYLRALDVLYGEGDKEERDDAYAEALSALAARYPDDLDAAAFHALALLGTAHEGRDFTTYMRAAAIAEEVFAANPRHPGAAHYLIHAYDDPVHAPLGLRAARVYAEIAPSASHALHMPSHIHVALGQWDEATALNVRSYEAARAATEARNERLNGHGWHALYWLAYSELQRGRTDEARRLLDQARSLNEDESSGRALSSLIAMRANYVVETQEWSGDVARWDLPLERVSASTREKDLFVRSLAAWMRGDKDEARALAGELAAGLDVNARTQPATEAYRAMLQALDHREAGDLEAALAALASATEIEDAMPLDFGPPNPVKPTHELFGEVLLSLGRHAEAVDQFELALARAPRRALSLEGLTQALDGLGRSAEAEVVRAELGSIRAERTAPAHGSH